MALALYRKYRPATFAEVVGQEHVTEPLRTALAAGRINHAYLFSGPRGCGKTSSARILARSLNCVNGPTPDPCGKCASCIALAPEGPGSLDVVELDAASHGGVDDTRDLRDKAFYMPAESRYRVFIIDEAHMVTTQGFNALLKIVEEPPEHLVFVFATTEPDKVLTTIRSRTHHYPFRLIPPTTLRNLLEQLCAQEGAVVEPAVFPLVIKAGGGSARDSLSVLDQLLAGAGPEGVTYRNAVALLGVTDSALLDEVVDALAAGDGASVFGAIDRVVEAGHDPRRFATDLLERLRDLVIINAVPDAAGKGLIDAPDDQLDAMVSQAGRLGTASSTRMAEVMHTGLVDMRGTTSPRLVLELLCARMLLPEASTGDAALLQRLERMERRMEIADDAGRSRDRTSVPPAAQVSGGRAQTAATPPRDTGEVRRRGDIGEDTRRDDPGAIMRTADASAVTRRGDSAASTGSGDSAGASTAKDRSPVSADPAGVTPSVDPSSRSAEAAPNEPADAERHEPHTATNGDRGPQPRRSPASSAVAPDLGLPPPPILSSTPHDTEPSATTRSSRTPYGDGQEHGSSRPPQRDGQEHGSSPPPRRSGQELQGSGQGQQPRPADKSQPADPGPATSGPGEPTSGPRAPTSPTAQSTIGVIDVRRVWPEVLSAVQRQRRTTQILLESATVVSVESGVLHLAMPSAGMARRVLEPANADLLRAALAEVLGVNWTLRCDTGPGSAPSDTAAPRDGRKSGDIGIPVAEPVVAEPDDDIPDDYGDPTAQPAGTEAVRDPEEVAIALLSAELGARRLDPPA